MKINKKLIKINNPDKIKKTGALNVLDVPLKFKKHFQLSQESAVYVRKFFDITHDLCSKKKLKA